jgi:hypothetical protein
VNNQYIFIPGLFILGTAAGIAMMYSIDDRKPAPIAAVGPVTTTIPDISNDHPMASAFMVSQDSDSERIMALEQHIELLSVRIEQLEQEVIAAKHNETEQPGPLAVEQTTPEDPPVRNTGQALTTENLVRAGIDEAIAADIIRRKNEVDLQSLELRDRATREGYLGTSRYSRELSALLEQDVSLREEIGDDAYDRYLYATGQSNRVSITSVMLGSSAEQAGIKSGDVVLSYADSQLFNWSELQAATTDGERGEYVNVTVLRDGQRVNLWLPRGPLGVRLSSSRLQP